MSEKILFVDDEPQALDGYSRILHDEFQISTASSGKEAIQSLQEGGPYAVVVSDMQMPGMDGIQLLGRVREISPQIVRVVLTGHADIEIAMNAVNEDSVFRFLTKPCPVRVLKKTLTACLLQYRMATAEKELLENTLMGSIKVLTDVLSLANPAAFGRATRIKRYVQHMVRELRLECPWKYEAAALLSQLGCITLEPELLDAAYRGELLPLEEQANFDAHPSVACELLANIPRLEGIARIVGRQLESAPAGIPSKDSIETGVIVLQIAIAFDKLKAQGRSDPQAIEFLKGSHRNNLGIVQLLETLPSAAPVMEARSVAIRDLEAGMIVDQELRSTAGLLLVGKGQEVTSPLATRLKNFQRRGTIQTEILVLVAQRPTLMNHAATN